jgi:hypothetical protein
MLAGLTLVAAATLLAIFLVIALALMAGGGESEDKVVWHDEYDQQGVKHNGDRSQARRTPLR